MDVEVAFPDICGAFYQASLLDINVSEEKCLLSFQDGWKPNTWVDLQYVRYPPSSSEPLDLSSGTKVEALLPFKEGEPSGWWLASINKSKGEIAGIQFQMTDDTQYSDLVEHKNLRMPNQNAPLSQMKFYQKEFPVPKDIQDFCRDPKVHSNFRNKVQALNVTYDSEKQSLIVLADHQKCLDKSELLIDMHFSDLSTQAQLKSRTERVFQRLQLSNAPPQATSLEEAPDVSGLHEEKFFIVPELIGFAMGKQGWNVKQARELEGVISIDFDDFNSMFTIRAETKEAALNARELIEFVHEIQYIPRDLAGKVIGRGGNIVQQILEKSKLNNIKVIGDEEARERKMNTKDVPFELVGRRKAIDNAKMMFDYHLDHLREVNSILKDREEITRKLRDSGLEEPPTFYPRPNPPRAGRGRGRGRPRGGGSNPRSNRPGRQRDRGDEEEEEEDEEGTDEGRPEEKQQPPYSSNDNNNGDGDDSDESDSTEEEQQNQDNINRVDSPAEDNGPTVSPDRRRKKRNRGYKDKRKRTEPPQTAENNHTNEDWPLPNESADQQQQTT